MILVPCEQGSDAWRAARAGLATASDFATIMAKGQRAGEASTERPKLALRLALERVNGAPAGSGFDSYATRQGREREPEARRAFEVYSGELVESVGFIRHATLAAGCSPDGLIGADGGLEIKSPQPLAHMATLTTRKVPGQYVAQVQGGMWICRRRWWRFVSFSPDFPEGKRLVVIEVERDGAYIDRLAAEVEVFLGEVDVAERALRQAQGQA